MVGAGHARKTYARMIADPWSARRADQASPVLMYDDPDIRVLFQPGGSDVLLVTFGDAVTLADGTQFTADRLARRQGLACLGFMAHRPNWFPAASIARSLPHIAYTLGSFGRRLLYGSSMGAYAALKHARLLDATEVMALGPQWSIDPAECAPVAPGYQEHFVPSMGGMSIRAEDVAGRVAIFLDPGLPSDVWHADAIRQRCPSVTFFYVHNVDHHLAPALAGSEAMWRVMRAWLDDDRAGVMAGLNRRRRASPVRTRVLLGKAVRRHPVLAMQAIRHVVERRGGDGLDTRGHTGLLLAAALARGDRVHALNVLRQAGALPPLRAAALWLDLTEPGGEPRPALLGLVTAHGAALCYDLVRGVLCASQAGLPWHHKVTLGQSGEHSLLAVQAAGEVLACARDAYGALELVRLDQAGVAPLVRATGIGDGKVLLQVGEHYLSAQPDGSIDHDRTRADAWEVFGWA